MPPLRYGALPRDMPVLGVYLLRKTASISTLGAPMCCVSGTVAIAAQARHTTRRHLRSSLRERRRDAQWRRIAPAKAAATA